MALQYNRPNKRVWGQRLTRLIVMVLGSIMIMQAAYATNTPTSPCDPNYMNALEARAYLEAQREVAQNENLIVKPDSVLDYSCFAEFLGVLGNSSGQFSNQSAPGQTDDSSTSGGSTALDTALTDVVGATLSTYLTLNFGNPGPEYIGGRFTPPNPASKVNPRDDKVSTDDDNQHRYDCDQMAMVWGYAHCMNFFNNLVNAGGTPAAPSGTASSTLNFTDGFYDFPWYETNDPRNPIPTVTYNTQGCVSPIVDSTLQVAFNNNATNYTIKPENTWPTGTATPYTQDPVVTHLNQILPVGALIGSATDPAATVVTCQPPIPTGICVVRVGVGYVYPDGVCPNPGCHYVMPSSGQTTCPTSVATMTMGTCVAN